MKAETLRDILHECKSSPIYKLDNPYQGNQYLQSLGLKYAVSSKPGFIIGYGKFKSWENRVLYVRINNSKQSDEYYPVGKATAEAFLSAVAFKQKKLDRARARRQQLAVKKARPGEMKARAILFGVESIIGADSNIKALVEVDKKNKDLYIIKVFSPDLRQIYRLCYTIEEYKARQEDVTAALLAFKKLVGDKI